MQGKKFISPHSWFSLIYPSSWSEFEDKEGTFLFYNPTQWTGNFRISAYKKDIKAKNAMSYADEEIQYELNHNKESQRVKIGSCNGVYYQDSNKEEGVFYTTHHWLLGKDNMILECTFTVPQGVGYEDVLSLLDSIEIRDENKSYLAELIPIRLAEIYEINEMYEEVTHLIKTTLTKDFQGIEEDLQKLQEVIDNGVIGGKKRKDWFAVGLVICVILYNEIDGFEWKTLIEGTREAPILYYTEKEKSIDPLKIAWEYVEQNGHCDVATIYKEILGSL